VQETGNLEAKTVPDRRTLVAYHEAGHAVTAYDQGIRIHGISIVAEERRTGHIRIDTLLLDRLAPTFRSDKGARNRFTMERHVMVLLGGYSAVRRLHASKVDESENLHREGSDHSTAMNLLLTFAADEAEAAKYYEWLKARTNGIINSPLRWFQLEKLAGALLDHEKLGARRVRETLREAEMEWGEKCGTKD
jgi:hypothetical protein